MTFMSRAMSKLLVGLMLVTTINGSFLGNLEAAQSNTESKAVIQEESQVAVASDYKSMDVASDLVKSNKLGINIIDWVLDSQGKKIYAFNASNLYRINADDLSIEKTQFYQGIKDIEFYNGDIYLLRNGKLNVVNTLTLASTEAQLSNFDSLAEKIAIVDNKIFYTTKGNDDDFVKVVVRDMKSESRYDITKNDFVDALVQIDKTSKLLYIATCEKDGKYSIKSVSASADFSKPDSYVIGSIDVPNDTGKIKFVDGNYICTSKAIFNKSDNSKITKFNIGGGAYNSLINGNTIYTYGKDNATIYKFNKVVAVPYKIKPSVTTLKIGTGIIDVTVTNQYEDLMKDLNFEIYDAYDVKGQNIAGNFEISVGENSSFKINPKSLALPGDYIIKAISKVDSSLNCISNNIRLSKDTLSISGNIALPDGKKANEDIIAYINIDEVGDTNYAELSYKASAVTTEVKIAKGNNGGEFKIVDIPSGKKYTIRYVLDSDLSGYKKTGYYSDEGTTQRSDLATPIDVAQIAIVDKNLEIIPERKISGTISIPNQTNIKGIYVTEENYEDKSKSNIPTYDISDISSDINSHEAANIYNNSSSVPFTLTVPKSIPGMGVIVKYIVEYTDGKKDYGYYNKTGTVAFYDLASRVDTSAGDVGNINMSLIEKISVSGAVYQIQNAAKVTVKAQNSCGFIISKDVAIPSGSNKVTYTIDVPKEMGSLMVAEVNATNAADNKSYKDYAYLYRGNFLPSSDYTINCSIDNEDSAEKSEVINVSKGNVIVKDLAFVNGTLSTSTQAPTSIPETDKRFIGGSISLEKADGLADFELVVPKNLKNSGYKLSCNLVNGNIGKKYGDTNFTELINVKDSNKHLVNMQLPITGVAIAGGSQIQLNGSATLTANKAVKWTSLNTDIVTIEETTGIVKGLKKGVALVKAENATDSTEFDYCYVIVNSVYVAPTTTTTTKTKKRGGGGGGGGGFVSTLSSNAQLSTMVINGANLSPVFDGITMNYKIFPDKNVTKVRFTPTTEDQKAKIKIDGKDIVSGTTTDEIDLTNPRDITIVVTAENGSQNTYVFKYTAEVLNEDEIPKGAMTDISSHWAEIYVKTLTQKNIVSGYPDKTFRPDNQITRAEAVVVICKMLGLQPASAAELTFNDNGDIADWSKGYIKTAIDKGIVKGYTDNTFKPSNVLTRTEMAVMTVKALGKEVDLRASTTFGDDGEIGEWAKGFVVKANEMEIIKGYPDNTFKPAKSITRAEVSTIIAKALPSIK